MDQFRIALISIGVFAIVGILAHGMWTIRKNNKEKNQENDPDGRSHGEAPNVAISDDDPLLSGILEKKYFFGKFRNSDAQRTIRRNLAFAPASHQPDQQGQRRFKTGPTRLKTRFPDIL